MVDNEHRDVAPVSENLNGCLCGWLAEGRGRCRRGLYDSAGSDVVLGRPQMVPRGDVSGVHFRIRNSLSLRSDTLVAWQPLSSHTLGGACLRQNPRTTQQRVSSQSSALCTRKSAGDTSMYIKSPPLGNPSQILPGPGVSPIWNHICPGRHPSPPWPRV